MRNLVVFCDGTWNTPDESKAGIPAPTNVAKLRNAAIEDATQRVYYHPGVGTGAGWWDKIVGGGTGAGLDQNTMSAYAWLARTYQPGDRIWLFGFSRGAYTARTCGGLIIRHGLLDLSTGDPTPSEQWTRVQAVYASYRSRTPFANPDGYLFFNAGAGEAPQERTPIYFVGVWDTVGALGVPDDFALLGLLNRPADFRFHDTTLSDKVAHARHAVAIDERRASFAPTLWSNEADHPDARQLYFPGVHSDVGGGYPIGESGLSDGALQWMMGEAVGCGLEVHPDAERQLAPDPLGILHESAVGIFDFLKTRPRSVPILDQTSTFLHESAKARLRSPPITQGPYWPGGLLPADAPTTVEIFARQRWNRTPIYLEAGVAYAFAAAGRWVDGNDDFDASGGKSGFDVRDVAHFAAGLLDHLEPLYARLAHEPNVDFWYTRRVGTAPWMALVGFVANDTLDPDLAPDPNALPVGETFVIGETCSYTPAHAGYLYAFANDAWQAYGNNRGSLMLTVSKA